MPISAIIIDDEKNGRKKLSFRKESIHSVYKRKLFLSLSE